ncbi:sulfite exporter TauE/SafE family protein [Paraglaciecola sp. 2405UD69-4]|uniref:sulfite exporter TauE/SafE family protein n=1 Tax=Paraglaciecola sp. 2405UD69-4 TaxID=3391836 RepID=UPI0039C9DF37
MNDLSFLSALVIGLAGGVHCVGMCGGIVGAFSYAIPKGASTQIYAISYNLGRISSYTLAGVLTGWLGQMVSQQVDQGIVLLQFISSIFLAVLGLYIAGWWQGLLKVEALGRYLWRYIGPLSKKMLPFKSPLQAFPYGAIWGWLPCGLVYSVLTWSLASGSAINGAKIMLGFGLGTIPIMFLMALGFEKSKAYLQHPIVKKIMGVLLLIFALFQMYHTFQSSMH